jgi:hypothetical protein
VSRHVDAIVNRFEAEARAVRVARIVAVIPVSTDAKCNADALAYLESATPQQRAAFARQYAGLKRPPSDTTWRLVVEAVRARMTPQNTNSLRDPADAIT